MTPVRSGVLQLFLKIFYNIAHVVELIFLATCRVLKEGAVLLIVVDVFIETFVVLLIVGDVFVEAFVAEFQNSVVANQCFDSELGFFVVIWKEDCIICMFVVLWWK